MDFFQLSMRILSAFLMLYLLLIMMRVVLSWIPDSTGGIMPIRTFINRMTDPYMNRFKGISWLRFGMFDFSPVLGLTLLIFLLYITQRLSTGSLPSAGELIIIAVELIWGLIAFLATLLGIIMIIRFVLLYTKKEHSNWTTRLDTFLFPQVSKIIGLFTKRTVTYPIALAVSAVSLIGARILINQILIRFVYPLLMQL